MATRKRWTMAGPWPHPKTGIFWFRKATPLDLKRRKEDLVALGVPYVGEFQRSLETRDPRQAATRYAQWLPKVQAMWSSWRKALDNGPESLSLSNATALAAIPAKKLFQQYADDPLDAPRLPREPEVAAIGSQHSDRAVAKMTPREKATLRSDIIKFLASTSEKRERLRGDLIKAYPFILADILPDFAATMEEMYGPDTDETLAAHGIIVDAGSRRLVNFETALLVAKVRKILDARLEGDWSEPTALSNLPKYKSKTVTTSLTFDQIIDAQVAKRGLGKDAKGMPEKSSKKYRRVAEEFRRHRKSANATTVRGTEVEAWGNSMQEAGKLSNRTIAGKLVDIGTIIGWGKKLFREEMAEAESISGVVELPDYKKKPYDETAYKLEEAKIVLRAARLETGDVRKRWMPWLCAYTGLRISEAEALTKDDFFKSDGLWFVRITSAGKRSLKTANAERRIPIHEVLIDEGLIAWIEKIPDGRLFKSGATSHIGRWVRSKAVGVTREGLSPNHGWRHLFKGLCWAATVDGTVTDYLMGHSTAGAGTQYNSTEAALPGLHKWLNLIKPIL